VSGSDSGELESLWILPVAPCATQSSLSFSHLPHAPLHQARPSPFYVSPPLPPIAAATGITRHTTNSPVFDLGKMAAHAVLYNQGRCERFLIETLAHARSTLAHEWGWSAATPPPSLATAPPKDPLFRHA
jgi:hypothetical protein